MAIRSDSASNAPEQQPASTGHSQIDANTRQKSLRTVRRSKLKAAILAGSAALILTGSAGCSIIGNAYSYARRTDCLDDFMLSHRNRVFAQRAWFREQACHAGQANLSEFKAGFIKGYIDVANGGSGCTPSVAPTQYWGWKYQSPGGQAAIGAFFAGYPYGAKAAEQDGLSNWSNVRPHTIAETESKKSSDEMPAPAPVMYGPDGMPLQEYIVPGSEVEVILPNPESATEIEVLPGGDIDVTPQELPPQAYLPAIESPEMTAQPNEYPSETEYAASASFGVQSSNTVEAANVAPAARDLVDSPSDTAQSFSLNDEGVPMQEIQAQDGTEDSIEGIFGSIDLPKGAGQTPTDFALPPVGPAASTANAAGDEIPFKFE
ncbi:hypothetical protein LOC67_11135 [Stieleria sp. JC731]|uniref:hypothetical protein n=1 Tax=Pirellulaceae TaxID=2691357 RepID=UPI001E43EF78|nr:hypothetical protein [Stieleria sp. JC731]MCC9601101.1 hypothetical protein [Stieleria sp. JC731]